MQISKERVNIIVCLLWVCALLSATCNDGKIHTTGSPDTDSNADTDSDTDTDIDTDIDTDSDTDTDTDTDTDIDTDTSTDGQLAWAKRAGGSFGDYGMSISALSDGSSLVTGGIGGTATFGSGETNETTLNTAGLDDIFVAKYNPDGTLAWVKYAGGTGLDSSRSISALSDGSALVTGNFADTAIFGPTEIGETVLISDGSYDIFVAKYNADGTLAWAKRAGGSSGNSGQDISALTDASSLVTGSFVGIATFGPGETVETVLTADGGQDIFIGKYSADGILEWAKRAGGTNFDQGYGISALSDGSSLVTGYFGGTATFGLGETNETVLISDGDYDIFVASYSADGTLAWAKRAGGTDWDGGYSIFALSDGSSLLTGSFVGTATFGSGETNETVLNAAGWDDIFIAKYNADGTLAWAKRAGGVNFDQGHSISTHDYDSALVTGSFEGTVTFGPGEINETVLSSCGGMDIFVAKYNAGGTLAWAKRTGGTNWDYGYGISALSDGSSLVTGPFEGTAVFGQGETNETVLSTAGMGDIFVAKFGP